MTVDRPEPVAVIYYGPVRLTGDVGFFYDTGSNNAKLLFEVLRSFWGGSIPGVEHASDLRRPDQILQFGQPPNRIDLLTKISGVTFAEAWPAREGVTLVLEGGQTVPVPFMGLRHLIANKQASGRAKDIDDLNYLRRAARQA